MKLYAMIGVSLQYHSRYLHAFSIEVHRFSPSKRGGFEPVPKFKSLVGLWNTLSLIFLNEKQHGGHTDTSVSTDLLLAG